MSMLAQSMLAGQYAVVGRTKSGTGRSMGTAETGPAVEASGGNRRGRNGTLSEPPRPARARRAPAAAWSPAQVGAGADKWRDAYAEASAQLGVMSGKERQGILREAARERALMKQRLW